MSSLLIQLLLLLTILLLPVSNEIRKTVTVNLAVNEYHIATTNNVRTDILPRGTDHERQRFRIPYFNSSIKCLSIGSPTNVTLIFTQGSTGGISSPYVLNFVDGFSELENIIVFQGRKTLQQRANMFKTVIDRYHCNVIGGRSLGSRVAIATANKVDDVKALILVSFPLKSTKGENRDQLLFDINDGTDVLFVIGTSDPLCDLDKLKFLMEQMKTRTWLVVVRNADHRLAIEPSVATRPVGVMVGKVVARWIEERDDILTNCEIHWDNEKSEAVAGPWSGGL